jgi:hypothetical protein
MKINQIVEGIESSQGVAEGLADEFMKMAREKGYNPRLAGTPEQERERTQQMLAQRAKDRAEQEKQIAQADAAKLPELKAEYEQMKKEYESLGGSNWQYADREQNLSDRERKARSMEPALRNLAVKIHRAEQAGVAEGEPGDLEHELNKKEYNDDKIAGRYDPDEFDAMINRVKELAGRGPLVSIRGDDGITRNVPKKDLNK